MFAHVCVYVCVCVCRALTCLNWLGLVDDMLSITRNGLFPSAEDVSSLSLHFSLPAELPPSTAIDDDNDDDDDDDERGHQGSDRRSRGSKRQERFGVSLRPMTPQVVSQGRIRRVWTPLELDNPEFVAYLRKREKFKKDFLRINIVSCLGSQSCMYCVRCGFIQCELMDTVEWSPAYGPHHLVWEETL